MKLRWSVSLALAAALLTPQIAAALSAQEAILRAKPGVALITARIDAEVTLNCGAGPVTITPAPFVETGTGWFIDGKGWLLTNAHVVDPAYRMPAWVTHEIKKMAIEKGCVEPALRQRGLMKGQNPGIEEQIRLGASDRGLASANVNAAPQVTVQLSNGVKLPAEVKKFSAPLLIDAVGQPAPDSGRDLALLRVPDGNYPALSVATRAAKIGDAVHILGFPGVVLSHELLNQSAGIEASVTNGAVSGIKVDAIGQDLVQTDAPAAHGNSGGPAVGDDSTVLGVLTFVSLSASGAVVQGFNFLIPAVDVLKFLQGTEVTKPGQSKFNEPWFAGLSALTSEKYKVALARLGEANKLQPKLPDVVRAMKEADDKIKNPPPRPFPWALVALGVTVLSAGGYGGMWARTWWKDRFRVAPPQVIAFIERGLNPVLIDVRTKHDYETSPLKLPGSVRVDPDTLLKTEQIDVKVEPKQIVIAYDTTPGEMTSEQAIQILRKHGLDARILKGGLGGWTNARLPVEAKSSLPSIGLEIYKSLTLGDVERRTFEPNDYIAREGDDAKGEAFVIHSGSVEIRRKFNGVERTLAKLSEGQLIGEWALFRNAPRSADMIATSPTELLVLKHERLDWLIRNRPQLTMEVLKSLAEAAVSKDETRAK
ncbi:MAG: cyclic nucleotide-binding domain-containing protein [Candidatus Rokubacteria bacterium]|nr:cyclic nucleotide-binding domain-containing protein [Candidatus Rokubacteria bacterium]